MEQKEKSSVLSFTGRPWQWPRANQELLPPTKKVPDWLRSLLGRRGFLSPAEIECYMEPRLGSLDSPDSIADMSVAVGRLVRALKDRESIAVYGDYDVDGVCSTAILVDFLRRVGGVVNYYIPDRRSEGYGLHQDAIRKLAREATVLITTDCGITAYDEIALASSLGLDVVIVDHHQVPQRLPPALAALDPHRPDCAFPFKDLCATGVAFMLAGALRAQLRREGMFESLQEPDLRDFLDLTAIATVADMVPLVGCNRVLVSAGLRHLSRTRRAGLQALLNVSKITPERVSASDLGFRIGPRINARGRLSHAAEAVELMLTEDVDRARELAEALDGANRQRREVEKATVEEALKQIQEHDLQDDAGLCVSSESWHPGVLGLVAMRLVQRFQRPAVVIGEGGKGSGRSCADINLYRCIEAGRECLERFGGHPQAAGFTIKEGAVPKFRSIFSGAVQSSAGAPPYRVPLELDLELSSDQLHLGLVRDLEKLAPFGQRNPEPLFVSRGLKVVDKRIVGETHLKLRLGDEAHDAIAFGMGHLAEDLPNVLDVAYRLEANIFMGRESLQLMIEDMRASH